jgi:dihydroflavonol-4-reductase
MRQALVTGGSGFIGQHLVTALLAHGRRVRVLDVRPPRCSATAVQYVRGSILDSKLLEATLDDVEEVYHLAGLPGMWARHKNDFHLINAQGTAIVIAAARKRGVSRFLHCSTESILFRPSYNGICPRRRRRRHARANARGLHALENAGRTGGFASCGVGLPRDHC